LLAHATHGSLVRLSLQRLLPPGLVAAIAEGPPQAVLQALAQRMETPECIWDAEMAATAATQVTVLAADLRARHAATTASAAASVPSPAAPSPAAGVYDWSLPPGAAVQYDKLRGELFVGGAYVRLFLKQPRHPLRQPGRFAEGLMERYLPELASPARDPDLLVLLAAAAVALIRSHPNMAEHLCRGGYLAKLLAQLAALIRPLLPPPLPLTSADAAFASATAGGSSSGPGSGFTSPRGGLTANGATQTPSPQQQQQGVLPAAAAAVLSAGVIEACGSALRLLHQLCDSVAAAEALATMPTSTAPPAVQVLYGAMRLGSAAAAAGGSGGGEGTAMAARLLALETLKRALSPANRHRDVLVLQALQYGLVPELLALLEWQQRGGAGGATTTTTGAAASGGGARAAGDTTPGGGGGGGGGGGDVAVLRVLAVDVLRALHQPPGLHSGPVCALLDGSPVWQAYCHQRHDLFLPAGAGAAGGSVVGLLEGPQSARFALPPPEALEQ
ncbi:hypothetical protein Agub_g8026, partial [Astrephomene gubernaculifera]